MQGPTKKRHTDRAEARFVGRPESIMKLRRLAKELDLEEVRETGAKAAGNEENTTVSLGDVFPELLVNPGGVAIRGYRSREGMTQKRLAELTGISQHHLSDMERGKTPIGKERAKRLAAALNCDYRTLL